MSSLYLNNQSNLFDARDQYDESIEKDIQAYADSLAFDEAPHSLQLLTPNLKKAKLIEQLKEDCKMPELAQFLDNALAFIKSDGFRYLDYQKFENVISEFQHASSILENFDPSQDIPVKCRDLLEISDEVMHSIYDIAKGAFNEERNQESLSVLVLLTTFDQTNSDFWLRMGIVAQKCKNLDLALKAYSLCIGMDLDPIGARLLSAQCYLIQGNQEKANFEITEAKKLLNNSDVDSVWHDFLTVIEK